MYALEIIEWVLLVVALIVLIVQFRTTDPGTYRWLNTVFWILIAGMFVINGLESEGGWEWAWYIAAAFSAAAAIASAAGSPIGGGGRRIRGED